MRPVTGRKLVIEWTTSLNGGQPGCLCGWLAAAAVIAALPGETATRNPPARVLHSE